MMRKVAAGLALLTALAHSIVGTLDALYPSVDQTVPLAAFGPVLATWYILGAMFFWTAWAFWRGSDATGGIAWVYVVSALIFVVIALVEAGVQGLVALPQWTLLGATGIVGLLAAKTAQVESADGI